MKPNMLDEYLFRYTESELHHLNDPVPTLSGRYKRIPQITFHGRKMYQFHFGSLLKNNLICVNKESRFTFIPEHIHTVIEFLYVYAGKCTQIIDGQRVEMTQGDICLLDVNVPHSIEFLEKEDIIITIEMRRENLTNGLLQRLGNKGIITSFLVSALSAESEHDQYLLFQHREDSAIHTIMQAILCEYFDPALCTEQIIDANVILLYCELLRNYRDRAISSHTDKNGQIVTILEYIEQNWLTVTLESAARKFGFHPNYLSAYIRKETGLTFKQLVISQRMYQACCYLTTTGYPVAVIAEKTGYENLGFFYRKFQELYGMTPAEYRNLRCKG